MKSEFLYLHHIRERCERIVHCVDAGREKFFGDVVYQDAVMRNLEVIGEVAKRAAQAHAPHATPLPNPGWGRAVRVRDPGLNAPGRTQEVLGSALKGG